MTPEKDAIIKSLKKYFQITELVCPDVYKRFNERAWQFFTTDALYGLLLLREAILCRPMYLNNYKKGITQRGLRCNLCALEARFQEASLLQDSKSYIGLSVRYGN